MDHWMYSKQITAEIQVATYHVWEGACWVVQFIHSYSMTHKLTICGCIIVGVWVSVGWANSYIITVYAINVHKGLVNHIISPKWIHATYLLIHAFHCRLSGNRAVLWFYILYWNVLQHSLKMIFLDAAAWNAIKIIYLHRNMHYKSANNFVK